MIQWRQLVFFASLIISGRLCTAQCADKTSWNSWLNCVIDARVTERSGAIQARIVRDGTVRNGSKKAEGSAIESSSTSLVDQTSRPDLLGLAPHLPTLHPNISRS